MAATQRVQSKAVEDKVLSIISREKSTEDEEEEKEVDENLMSDSESGIYENYYFEEEDFDVDYLKLGPLELKLLSITGQQMPIHVAKTPSEEEMKQYRPDEWPASAHATWSFVDKHLKLLIF
ncbi:hypothetical protein Btru_063967 [Bulinus truncatus]|nr:hypothetical protein Btru_063967 [Bulinus truncatus]